MLLGVQEVRLCFGLTMLIRALDRWGIDVLILSSNLIRANFGEALAFMGGRDLVKSGELGI